MNFVGIKIHRDWPWKRVLTIAEIISVQPMTASSESVFEFEYVYEENEE